MTKNGYAPMTAREIARMMECVAALDRLDVPLDWSRRKATMALDRVGEAAGTAIIGAAVRYRREYVPTLDDVR